MVSLSRSVRSLQNTILPALLVLGFFAAGCNESKPESAGASPTPAKTNQLQTGRFALQKMIVPAHLWAGDAAPVQLASTTTADSDGHDGKAAVWRAVFASPARQKSEPFIWSGLADAPTPVDHGQEDSFNPSNRSTQTWDLNFLKVDTDQAFAVAQKHGGKALLEKEPQLRVNYLLDFSALTNQLRWHVIYGGDSIGKLTVIVDASTGEFLHKE